MISMIVSSDMAWSESNTCFQRPGRLGQFVHQPSVPNRRLAAFWTFDAMTVRIADLTAGYSASTTSRGISSEMTSITASWAISGAAFEVGGQIMTLPPTIRGSSLRHYAG
jgi:hypothetical protein